MIWAIHPTIFELAREKPTYAVALEHIADQVEKAEDHIAFDGNGLFEKYIELTEQCLIDPSPNVQAIIRLFQPIQKGFDDYLAPLSAPVIDDFGDIYNDLKSSLECNRIEAQLLLVALNSKHLGKLNVLLPETDCWNAMGINPTRFYRPEAGREITRCLRKKGVNREEDQWFHIRDISDMVQINHQTTSGSVAHIHSQKFEMLAKEKFLKEADSFSSVTVPADITKSAGQVDVYLESPSEILVAECKLRDRGNEGKLIDGDEMGKVCRVVEATINHLIRIASPPIKLSGYLVSNANGVHPNAWEVYRNYSANWREQNIQIEIAFRRAVLPNKWHKQDAFGILRLEEPVFDEE